MSRTASDGASTAAYPAYYLAQYIAPGLSLDWLLLFGLGELVFMVWMLTAGWRLKDLR